MAAPSPGIQFSVGHLPRLLILQCSAPMPLFLRGHPELPDQSTWPSHHMGSKGPLTSLSDFSPVFNHHILRPLEWSFRKTTVLECAEDQGWGGICGNGGRRTRLKSVALILLREDWLWEGEVALRDRNN